VAPALSRSDGEVLATGKALPDGRTMVNYVAGQPFPFLVPNHPSIATKSMWNNSFRPTTSDDYDLRFYDCEDMYTGRNRPYRVLDYFQIGHYARLAHAR